ncbi:alcohol dehydrogenase catalytic domain-containing protein [Sinosporangium siamense]|uniref:2-deoxy-scyllo-inosamine dehydrogenase n=1 Tax=Sinosporangium siamense TaxID=1367973 RepID=A0A919RPB2_9ACTN|nr:alcohol dehydrogenase catalytic domain-containing protein [Sinosporangium siamense]GII96545.1 2-deoxy-scyllo-inosamine dehydrogenase [Sinosporangium siamense]
MTMKVANTVSAHRLEYQERPIPALSEGTALIRVEHVTLCGTDSHIWQGEYLNPFPIVQGHEFAGRVEQVAGDTPITPGEAVVVSPVRSCGTCHPCRIGRANVCQRVSVLGCYEDGALAHYVLAPIETLRKVPPGLPGELAPLSEPASIAMQAVRRSRAEAGELALVIGCGPIGLIATLYLHELGVDVVAADTLPARAESAKHFGAVASVTVDPTAPFPTGPQISTLAAADPARPVTIVIEATGSPAAFAAALDVAAPTGRVVMVGISDRDTRIPMRTIPLKELDVLGSRNSLDLIGDGLQLIARHQDRFTHLITHRFGFHQVEQAFNTMHTEAENVRKVLITMDGADR